LTTPITIIVAVVMIVIALIILAVIVGPIITLVIGAVILLVELRSLANVFLDLLVDLVSVCPLLCHRE
jgi:hypothetical protein